MPTCYYCERELRITREGFPFYPLSPTRDHKIPRSRGGRGADNIVIACRDCNELKGDLTDAEFDAAIAVFVAEEWKLERVLSHYKPLRNHNVWPLVAQRIERPVPSREDAGSIPAERAIA